MPYGFMPAPHPFYPRPPTPVTVDLISNAAPLEDLTSLTGARPHLTRCSQGCSACRSHLSHVILGARHFHRRAFHRIEHLGRRRPLAAANSAFGQAERAR
eukprot:scaffold45339_cov68-Phaeocystis_antarctica.AAC.1